ncbi:MAG TPA: zinc ribbon domain-containing protein [Casimicrobiaceae bacterium]|nr:zinc ribbon domain-containing protein [Casimicrobiaceae bacterium]
MSAAPPPETAALAKFACPACGAEALWNPAKQALVCPFCGTSSPATLDADTGKIVEHDLVAALRGLSDDARGWKADKRCVKCQSCQAISVLDPVRQAQLCEFCGSAQLVPYEQAKESFRPESVLPFKVSEDRARDGIRAWYGKLWLAPNALKRRALTDTVKGVYVPYWTFDAQAEATWTAEAGHYYYTTESYTDGSGRVQARQVQHVRWEPAAGQVSHFFDDDLVCASVGVHPNLVRGVEPFPTKELKPYDPGYVAGWLVERYQIDLVAAAKAARDAMDAQLRQLCAAQIAGDTYRNLQVRTSYSGQTFKHILAPVWLLTYGYGARAYQALMNGVTGSIQGEYPKSWVKLSLLVIAIIVVAAVAISFGSHR